MTRRVGLLWRGDRTAAEWSPKARQRLGPLFAALADAGIEAQAVVYDDDAVGDVREQLRSLDTVLVWVNPIQDGVNRARLDALLREVADAGATVSAHPDVVARLATKEVLYETRDLGWGSDADRYVSPGDFATRFPQRLARDGVRVLKQARGNGGNGVWKVELVRDGIVRVQHAADGYAEEVGLDAFVARCGVYFAWSGCLVDQPFVARLADGLVRCYFVRDTVVGFCEQWPRGLRDEPPDPARVSVMEPVDTARFASLRASAERDWVPAMQRLLGLGTSALPLVWDADFLLGERTPAGDDTYVLCEINASAVWPFPPDAVGAMVRALTAAE